MRLKIFAIIALTTFVVGCQDQSSPTSTEEQVSTDYRKEITDEKAAALVSKMMDAMGGVKQWDELKYVSWTFFGSRHLIWDKVNNRVRIESPGDSSIYLVDLDNSTGRYAYNGEELLDETTLSEKMKRGKGIWINDMYWLFMPFKLQDPGVTVRYMRADTTLKGVSSDVLELTFENVGNTPENKYEVYIDQSDHLIKQWDFYAKSDLEEPSRQWPWDNYKDYEGLLLSSERSDNKGPSNVRVYDDLEDKVFTSFEPFEFY